MKHAKHSLRRRTPRWVLAVIGVMVLALGGVVYAATTSLNLNGGDTAALSCAGSSLSVHKPNVTQANVSCVPSATPTTSTPPPTTTSSPSGYSCKAVLNDACGAYDYPQIPMSNGYDTYVSNQPVDVHGTETVYANTPGDWQVVASLSDCGGCVQTFPDSQQLTNDWCGTGWGGCPAPTDTPLANLSSLTVNYSETSPTDAGSSYEFAPDVWQDNYNNDVMFWVDTKGRCDEGSYGPTLLGHVVLDGQSWTVHRYDDAATSTKNTGNEIIFVLDGPGGSGTCAQQSSGSIDIKAGLQWLVANGFEAGPVVLPAINTGWEITQADGTAFTVTSYSITATVG